MSRSELEQARAAMREAQRRATAARRKRAYGRTTDRQARLAAARHSAATARVLDLERKLGFK